MNLRNNIQTIEILRWTSCPLIQILTSIHSWRWCFYINLPPGAIVAALIFYSKIPEGQIVKPKAAEVVKDLHNRLDFVGFFLFAPSITMLLLAVQWGGNE